MPIVQGYHVPEIDNARIRPKLFNILLLDLNHDQLSTITIYVSILHNYLDTLNMRNHRINLHVSNNLPNVQSLATMYPLLKLHEFNSESKTEILEIASNIDLDIILDEKEKFTDKEVADADGSVAIVRYFNPEFNDLLNCICVGWGVPWNFRDPIWNASWITKYLEPNSLTRKAFDFMGSSQEQHYTADQQHSIRNLSNKLSQVSHSKQLLDYMLLLRRYAKRHNLKTEDVLFELSFHLSNYFLLISGSLDILARLINDVYGLGFRQYDSYTLDKQLFLDRLDNKRKGLAKIIRLNKYLDWMDWLRQRRNLLAHQSYLYLTPLIKQVKTPLTDEEINARVEASKDWELLSSSGLKPEFIAQMKEFKKFQIDLDENHETIAEDIMPINMKDRKTGDVKKVIYFPLKAINEDYKKMNELVIRILDNLISARPIT